MSHVAHGTTRVAVITGVSRAAGIGAALARRLQSSHRLFLTGHRAYDADQPYDDGGDGPEVLVEELGGSAGGVVYVPADLTDPAAPSLVIEQAVKAFGTVDSLVVNHTHSVQTPLGHLRATDIDTTFAVNVRASLLLVEHFARARRGATTQGRIVLFSSGQRLGPMPGELAYAASKGAMEAILPTLADTLATTDTTINMINPGPTDTGWADEEIYDAVKASFPGGRWGEPDDAARVVDFLLSSAASWLTGQVIDSEGGFRRWKHQAQPPEWDQ